MDLKGNTLPTITYTEVTKFWDKVFIREITIKNVFNN